MKPLQKKNNWQIAKQFIEKLREEDDYNDGFSEVDDTFIPANDEDFIPATPAPQKSSKRRLFSLHEKLNKKRAKKEEENQNKGSDEGSVQNLEHESTKENSGTASDNDDVKTSLKSGICQILQRG